MNIEGATLVLRTFNAINTPARGSSTWQQVNLRQTLGPLYNKYNRFKICLTSWGSSKAPTINSNNASVIALMSGFNWENQTYDTATNGLTRRAAIANVRYSSISNTAIENFTGEVGQVFIKPNIDEITVTISLERIDGGPVPTNPISGYPFSVYVFSIYGIPDDEETTK
jgi:hypothetical protein